MKHTVLVTGASRGIGSAIARAFAEDGHRVVIHCNGHQKDAESLATVLTARQRSVMVAKADLKKPDEVTRLITEVQKRYGFIDVLINNAGVSLPQKLLTDCSAEEWDELFSVNMRGTFLCTKAILPEMVRRQRGSIVNISSMWGVTGGSCEVPYSASKAAVIGFTRALAKEVAPSGIRVNCVAPGFVLTDMNAELDVDTVESIRLETPLMRLGTVEDIARTVLFMALENASFITGQVLCADGGRCI